MPNQNPPRRRVVVDGSNIATEGRTLPSLAQLDEAIRAFLEEYRGFTTADVTVVVDASFGHRIDPSEVATFEEAVLHGEMVTPPAGAVGRGDGFILRIAEKAGALVLSNDSFQEFHAERPWLFDEGRLIGGKPVPGVGWVFTPRTPVRGPRSRSVTGRSRRDARAAAAELEAVAELETNGAEPNGAEAAEVAPSVDGAKAKAKGKAAKASKTSKATKAAKATKGTKEKEKADKADKAPASAKATKSAASSSKSAKGAKAAKEPATTVADDKAKGEKGKAAKGKPGAAEPAPSTRASKAAPATEARRARATRAAGDEEPARAGTTLNEPLTFLTFVAEHPVGSTLEGTVASYTSHGAHIDVGTMRCHVPLRGLGNPPPQKARDVLAKGESRQFVLVSLDAARRRAELALPGVTLPDA